MHRLFRYILSGAAVITGVSLASSYSAVPLPLSVADPDTIAVVEDDDTPAFLPGELRDTTAFMAEQLSKERQQYSSIHLLTRAYGDSIVLRWAAPDYVSWRFLNHVGVSIFRWEEGSVVVDTLVQGLKPVPLEEFRKLYPETDSLAMMGMGAVYNRQQANSDTHRDATGSVGNLYDVYGEQQMQLAVALLVAEWRPDVANCMAMRFVDRSAKKGRHYNYSIIPAEDDTTGHVAIAAGLVADVENKRYNPEPLTLELSDSITPPTSLRLTWPRTRYSSYEVERRQQGGSWKKVNDKPYIIMYGDETENCFIDDRVPEPGVYEYRVAAHDAFGDLTDPTIPYKVTVGDMIPPAPPQITGIVIDRPNEDAPGQEVWANIHFVTPPTDDLRGLVPMYQHHALTRGEWQPMLKDPLSPADTLCRINVTGLKTGLVTIAAYDTVQNVSYAIPQVLRVTDMQPPQAPTGLHAETNAEDGTIKLMWNALKTDDIAYYEVVFANDSTHEFLVQNHGQVTDTLFVDSVDMNANQKYIYYMVRAVDYATNQGPFSEMLPVIRPSNVPPTVAHIDSTSVTPQGVFMRWICGDDQQMARHHVLRRLDTDTSWTLLRVCDADSVKQHDNCIDIVDVPPVNSRQEWCYAVESFNYSGVSAGPSLQFHALYRGQLFFDCALRLHGTFDRSSGATRIVWEMGQKPPYDENDWYYTIYRQGPDDDSPRFLVTAEPDELQHEDYLLREGQEASYYIYVTYPDGRRSKPSNVVKVKR